MIDLKNMSKVIKNPQNEEGLKELNEILLDQSFVMGHTTPSQPDLFVLKVIGDADLSSFTGIKRWKKFITSFSENETKSWPNLFLTIEGYVEKKVEVKEEEEEDLFGEETEEEKKIKEEKKKADKEKQKQQGPIGKSSILIDIKPWDDETSIDEMESSVRSITIDGLQWQASKHIEVAYGIKKLQILCNIIDDKVSSEDLEEAILGLKTLVQSMDSSSFIGSTYPSIVRKRFGHNFVSFSEKDVMNFFHLFIPDKDETSVSPRTLKTKRSG